MSETPADPKLPKRPPSAGDLTDGRERYDWRSRYTDAASEIRWEGIYLGILLFLALVLILSTWQGWIDSMFLVPPARHTTFQRYAFYCSAGLLGGVLYTLKYLYRVVARGYWHQDRQLWRVMSPFLAVSVALVVGAMMEASLLRVQVNLSSAGAVSVGFLAGHFADNAVAKMVDIAAVLFGKGPSERG